MENQLDLIVEELKQSTLSIDEIEANELSKEDLFEIKIGSSIIGPFSGPFLKTYIEEKNLSDYNVLIKTIESILWVPFFQHPAFFSGEPGAFDGSTDIHRKRYYLLINGRKVGPYRIEDIDFKVKNNEVLFTDLVSEDIGVTWKKIYELEGFDLRKHDEENLPAAPEGQVLSESAPRRESDLEAVGELAQIGHQSSLDRQKKYSSSSIQEKVSLGARLGNIATFVAIIFITIFVFNKIDPFGTAPEKPVVVKKRKKKAVVKKAPRKKRVKPVKKVITPAEQDRITERRERRKKEIAKRRKQRSNKAVSKNKEEDPYPDDNNYNDEEPDDYADDDLAPKRKAKTTRKKKVTKKTVDDDYYNEDVDEDNPY